MGWSRFLSLLLLSTLVFYFIAPQVYGRRIKVVRHYNAGKSVMVPEREMAEMTMDYKEPGANTNPRSGILPPSPNDQY